MSAIAVLHPGEMGAAVGACLVARGHRVLWASEGRSAATRGRADAAGLEDLGALGRCLQDAQYVLSICPPQGALPLAREVAALGFRGTYADANPVSPARAKEIGRVLVSGGARFVDGAIIGPPPQSRGETRAKGRTRLYLSGEDAAAVAQLFAGGEPQAIVLEGGAGAASALKACYAGWNKNATALLACIRALARHEGVEAALLAEWDLSEPGIARRSERILASARKAWRWAPEMEEIADAFAAAGVPPEFQRAAAEVFRRLAPFKDAPAPASPEAIVEALRRQC